MSVNACECVIERVCECENGHVPEREGDRGERGVLSSLGIAVWPLGHTTARRSTFLRRSEPPSWQ